MKHIAISLLFLLSTSIVSRADGFLMWQAQKEGQTIHLLANIPILSNDLISRLGPEVQDAFVKSKLIVFEADPDIERRKEGRQQIINSALYPDGDDLLNHLPPATKKEFQKICQDYNIHNRNIVRLHPWMAAQNLLQLIMVRAQVRLGDDLERHFYRQATTEDKPLAFLNSPMDTINLFDSISEEQQVQILDKSIRDARTMTNFLKKVESAWFASDAEAATAIINESFNAYPDVRKALFESRNATWAAELESQVGIEEQIFALVSLSNLVGNNNLLDQLKSRGFLIAQVVSE